MQTLLDPFELARAPISTPAPSGQRLRVAAPAVPGPSQPWIDVELDIEDAPVRSRPGSDSSGRLRTWCSED